MTEQQLRNLKPGDAVRSIVTGLTYLITGNYGDHLTGVRTVDITNPPEWEIVHPRSGKEKR